MNNYKKIEEEIKVNLGGGFELSYKVFEKGNKIIAFMIATEYQSIMIFDKKDIEKIRIEINETEDMKNVNYVDILTSYEITEIKSKCINLNNFDTEKLYDSKYINSFLNKEVTKYFK